MKQTSNPQTTERPRAERLSRAFSRLRHFMGTPLARRLVLALFVLQAVTLVFVVRIGTPPDETNHIRFIEYYADHSLSPVFTHQQPTFNLGDKTREVDYLYHYTTSFVYRGLPLPAEAKYTVIRLLSVLGAVLCFLVLANLFKRLGFSAATITASLLVLTNLPMVLMMSAAVNNDVLVWLGMALGLLLLTRLWQRPTAIDVLWLVALAISGGLVKRTLLPLGVVFGLLALLVVIKHFRQLLPQFKRFNWQMALAIGLIVVGLGLFSERVGGNMLRYHSVAPSCERVDGAAACAVFWGNIRARHLAEQPPERHIGLAEFVVRWVDESLVNVVDIQTQGWRHEVKPARWVPPLLMVLLIVGLVYGLMTERRTFAASQQSRWRLYVMLITLWFMAVHLVVNYGEYKRVKFFGIALNGRYILPSLLPLAGFACFYWAKLLGRRPRLLAALGIIVVLGTIFGSGLLMMLRNPQLWRG